MLLVERGKVATRRGENENGGEARRQTGRGK